MARITVICISKNTSGVMTETVEVTTREETKRQLDRISELADNAYGRWYWEAEVEDGTLTPEEITMLNDMEIEID